MSVSLLDWGIVAFFMLLTLGIGIYAGKAASKNSAAYFLSGRNMPWWLLGMSMVATTFSTDTPNLVADITRRDGVSGNWVWWAFLLTGMLTTFVFARLWRRSAVNTDIEFYELRYSGKAAAFLRGFRAVYLGVFFNVLIMAAVTLAAIKFGAVILGLTPLQTVLIAGTVTVIFSAIGGFLGVLLTDFVLFILAMAGAVIAAMAALEHPEVGGLGAMLSHPNVADKLSFFPDLHDPGQYVPLLLIPLAVQWWSVWYPGSEPGGGGYVAQRMLAARNETHALGAVMFFNFVHYALRPWPWILVALASLIVFPDLESLSAAFPDIDPSVIQHDLAYPAMLTFLPSGLLGLVVASLIAAYMSTISTSLNLGASYVINDVYRRFIRPEADERHYVQAGRYCTVLIMVLACTLALALSNALQAFHILLSIGAGTGLLFILRWFWWRINAWSEITAMVVSFLTSLILELGAFQTLLSWEKLLITVGVTTFCWVSVAIFGPSTEALVLRNFYRLVRPPGSGWRPVVAALEEELSVETKPAPGAAASLGVQFTCVLAGVGAVYSALFGIGALLYGNRMLGGALLVGALVFAGVLKSRWYRVASQ